MLHNNNKLSFDAIGRKTRWPMSMAKVNARLSSANGEDEAFRDV